MSDPELLDRIRRTVVGSGERLDAVIRAHSGIADDAALALLSRSVHAELLGAGPLEPLLALPGVTDVLVNGASDVWIDRDGLQRTSVCFRDDAAVRQLAQRLAAAAGRRLDDASPFVDTVLPDGTRLHAILLRSSRIRRCRCASWPGATSTWATWSRRARWTTGWPHCCKR